MARMAIWPRDGTPRSSKWPVASVRTVLALAVPRTCAPATSLPSRSLTVPVTVIAGHASRLTGGGSVSESTSISSRRPTYGSKFVGALESEKICTREDIDFELSVGIGCSRTTIAVVAIGSDLDACDADCAITCGNPTGDGAGTSEIEGHLCLGLRIGYYFLLLYTSLGRGRDADFTAVGEQRIAPNKLRGLAGLDSFFANDGAGGIERA